MSSSLQVNEHADVKEGLLLRSVRKRYGIGMLAALILWVPAGSLWFLEALTGNVFLLDTYLQLAFLTVVNSMAVVFAIAIIRVLNGRFPGKFATRWLGDGSSPWATQHFRLATLFACVTPLLLAFYYGSEYSGVFYASKDAVSIFAHVPFSFFAIALGVAAAALFLFALNRAKCGLFGSDKSTGNYLPFETVDRVGLIKTGLGKRMQAWTGVEDVDIQLAIYFLLLGGAHYVLTRVFVQSTVGLSTAPAATVVLIWLAFLLLGGAANLLDRYRLPVVVVMIGLFSLLQVFRESTTQLKTLKDNSTNQFVAAVADIHKAEEGFFAGDGAKDRVETVIEKTAPMNAKTWEAIVQRIENADGFADDKDRTLVVVTCPGGGIHAAAWATFVLDQLCAEYPDFRNSICVVSGVSGGSVGSYLFVAHQYQDKLGEFETGSESSSFELATQSSLEPIAFGMMSDDLYGSLYHKLSRVDRGQRLEDSILQRVPETQQQKTMGQWGDLALAGELPIVIFNSTDAATGRRILFDTVPTPRRETEVGKTSRPYNYRELLSGKVDVSPATAARTSATFPYVSPFTRPSNASPMGEGVAICDGGYVDNEGIVTAIDWIDFLLKRWYPIRKNDDSPFRRVLLLRIAPASTVDGLVPSEKRGIFPSFRWLAGPLETIVNVRGASQSERGNLETDLAALYLAPKKIVQADQGPDKLQEVRTLMASPQKSSKSEAEKAALRKYQSYKTGVESTLPKRSTAQPLLDKMKDSKPIQKLKSATEGGESDEIIVGAMVNPSISTEVDAPVVVLEIPFDTGVKRVVPLNWKLSRKQKEWYRESWDQIFYRDSESGDVGELTELMDNYFRHK